MMLIDSLTDEEKIELYPREFSTILKCPKIPEYIVKRVLSKEATILEQMHFLYNKSIDECYIKILYDTTKYKLVRDGAFKRLYRKEEALKIGLETIRILSDH